MDTTIFGSRNVGQRTEKSSGNIPSSNFAKSHYEETKRTGFEPRLNATLAHVRQRYTLLAIYNEFAHMVELDVGGLIDTFGPDHPVPDCSNLYDDGFF